LAELTDDQGDWKLVWLATLPSKVELFDLAQDPGEKTDLSGQNPQKVEELQKRAEALAREAVLPVFLKESLDVVRAVQMSSVALPDDAKAIELEP